MGGEADSASGSRCQNAGTNRTEKHVELTCAMSTIHTETTGLIPWDFQQINCKERDKEGNSIIFSLNGQNETR